MTKSLAVKICLIVFIPSLIYLASTGKNPIENISRMFSFLASSNTSNPLAIAEFDEEYVEHSPMAKVGRDLATLYDEYLSYLEQDFQEEGIAFEPGNSMLQITDDRVMIEAIPSGDLSVLQSDLIGLGMQNIPIGRYMILGHLPISSIEDMAGLDSLQFAKPAFDEVVDVEQAARQYDVSLQSEVEFDEEGDITLYGLTQMNLAQESFNQKKGSMYKVGPDLTTLYNALRTDLEALGMQDISVFGRGVSGKLPIFAIDDLAALNSLSFARPAYVIYRVGRVISQGDAAMRSYSKSS